MSGAAEQLDTIVIGGGSAGLAVSHELTRHGVDHAVLERGRIGQSWRDRWDSFCLVTPNWSVQLPEGAYDGSDPDGFMPRDEIVAFLERYAAPSRDSLREGVEVTSFEREVADGFRASTSEGEVVARHVVMATGAFQRAHRPPGSDTLPDDLLQLDLAGYRNPTELPPGAVLVIGSGQSGCQLAEELNEAGRTVTLACGKAPWAPRRIADRDLVWWLESSGFLDGTVASLPSPKARLGANILATGHGIAHDLTLRTLGAQGVTLVGHFLGAIGDRALFAQDVDATVAWGDARYGDLSKLFRAAAERLGMPEPDLPQPTPFGAQSPTDVALEDFGAVIFAGGYRPDYRSWMPWPEAFDELGFPIQSDGTSTVVPNLHFVGLPFLRNRKSSLLLGVGLDATIVADTIASGSAQA